MRKLKYGARFRASRVRSLHAKPSIRDTELELLRRVVVKLESLSDVLCEYERAEMLEIHKLLLLLEVRHSQGVREREEGESASRVDWARLLPLLLAAGVVLGVVVAQLLGLDMRHAL